MIHVLKACQRELEAFPREVREDLADALARLDAGQHLSFPLSRPMPEIGKGVHEIRLRDRSGIYRVIYVILSQQGVYVLHGFQKKAQQTPQRNIEVAQKRLREVLK